jgi:uncharacterized membrane protein HdeD (DUF308 family)
MIMNVILKNWWILTIKGLLTLAFGVIAISAPISTMLFSTRIFVSMWISFMGILQISNGYRLRGLYNHYWILIFNGLLAISFALIVLTQPIYGIITLMTLIGLQAIVFGGFLVISSFYIRKIFYDIDTEIPHKVGEEANQELSYY